MTTPKDQHADDKAEADYLLKWLDAQIASTQHCIDLTKEKYAEVGYCSPFEGQLVMLQKVKTALSSQQCQPVQPSKVDVFADLEAKYGQCCQGAAPYCAAECQVERCIKRDYFQGHLSRQPSNAPPLDALERAMDELNSIPSVSGRRREIGQIRLHTLHHDTIRALLEAAISQKPVDAWQPIETYDYDNFPLVMLAGFITPSEYAQSNGSKPFWEISIGRCWHVNTRKFTGFLGQQPTHWMPLPPAPSQHPDKER